MKYLRLFLIGGVILATAGCATPLEPSDDASHWANITPFSNYPVKP